MIKKLLLFIAFIAICSYADAEVSTFKKATIGDFITTSSIEDDIPIEKSEEITVTISSTERSTLPFYGQVLLVVGLLLVLFLFLKYTWLNLELTNYNHWLLEHQRYNKIGKAVYPEPKAYQYLFNFRKYMLKDVLDPFTESEYRKWSENNTRKVYTGTKCFML